MAGHDAMWIARASTRRLASNWALVEHLCGAGELATRVGAGPVTSSPRLWRDRDRDRVELVCLNGSAPCSICTPAQLISRPLRATDSAAREPCPAAESSDVEVVEAALGALAPVLTAPISTARLAQALGWPRARIAAALGGLEDWFHGTGTRLDRDRDDRGGQLRVLRPRHTPLSTEQRAALHQLPLRCRHSPHPPHAPSTTSSVVERL